MDGTVPHQRNFIEKDTAVITSRTRPGSGGYMTGEADAGQCPYCFSVDDCPHLLLFVDITFRHAEGGVLWKVFNEAWSRIEDANGERADFDEDQAFRELLEEVDSLSAFSTEFEHDGGPGGCSGYQVYYAAYPQRANATLQQFTKTARQKFK